MVKTAKNKVYYLTYLLQILASTWVKVTIRVHFIIHAIEGSQQGRQPGPWRDQQPHQLLAPNAKEISKIRSVCTSTKMVPFHAGDC